MGMSPGPRTLKHTMSTLRHYFASQPAGRLLIFLLSILSPITTMDNHRRPANIHTKHLSDIDRIRIRTLFFNGRLNRQEISSRTGFSIT
ncbi:hypothetical protein LZ31DRAFT_225468 [Colletotrichum somersetense]|nr:hypothetical protein LZ31DRAFT_225468 [Colletotrichum somersetense]